MHPGRRAVACRPKRDSIHLNYIASKLPVKARLVHTDGYSVHGDFLILLPIVSQHHHGP